MPCNDCQQRHQELSKPKQTAELTSNEIKEERKLYADDIEQPWREGVLNKRYYEKYGTAGIKATQADIKNAKDVWDENHFYKDE